MQRNFKFTEASIKSKAKPPGEDELNGNGNPIKDRLY
jgi:hypothetical protein